eukprot:699182-Pelagomonas_calceolata.AAC.7
MAHVLIAPPPHPRFCALHACMHEYFFLPSRAPEGSCAPSQSSLSWQFFGLVLVQPVALDLPFNFLSALEAKKKEEEGRDPNEKDDDESVRAVAKPCCSFSPSLASDDGDEDGVVWMTDTSAEAAKQRAQSECE